jgi:hypothetical protein
MFLGQAVYIFRPHSKYVLVDRQQVSRMTILRWPKGSATLLSRYGLRIRAEK